MYIVLFMYISTSIPQRYRYKTYFVEDTARGGKR